MEQLSGIDTSFLYLDAPNQPMLINTILLFESHEEQPLDIFEIFRELVASKLHVAKIFRQRLVDTSLHIDYPYWIEDPDFNLDFHLHHLALPKPGSWQELCKLHSYLMALPLDNSRPLWEMYFIEGINSVPHLAKGSFAVMMKAHHAAIDGVSGAHILTSILDPTLDTNKMQNIIPWCPEPIPPEADLIKRSVSNAKKIPAKLSKLITKAKEGSEKIAKLALTGELKNVHIPFDVPRTRFDKPVSSIRAWDGMNCSLKKVRAIGKACHANVTINDVVLTICSGALRKYLIKKEELPEKPLVTMVPVSFRSEDEINAMGNRISAIFVPLATNEPDAGVRLRIIHENAKTAKIIHRKFDPEILLYSLDAVSSLLGRGATHLYNKTQDKKWPQLFNLVITNVPGPRKPFSVHERQLKSVYLSGPVLNGTGLFIGVFSYAGNLTINVTSCPKMMPDVSLFREYLTETLAELETIFLETV